MSLARLVITAVVLEGRRPIDVATDYGVSKGWVSKLVARYHAEGDSAFEPRSRRPHTSPSATPPAVVALIIATRDDLTRQGLDAGNATIAWHLDQHHQVTVSESTIHRYLVAAGLVTPEPRKKPRASYIRFQAELPNECWQADFTHYYLSTRDDTEILTWLDDHSRYALSITAHARVTGPIVIDTFTHSTVEQGIPYSTLTDNGMVFTTRLSGGGGRNGYENLLVRLGVIQKNSRPEPPHHLRQSRTVPTNNEEMAPRTTRPARHHQRTPTTSRHLPPRLQPPTPTPITPTPHHASRRLPGPTQSHPDRTRRHPLPHPSRPRQLRTASACASTATCTTSDSDDHSTEPASSCSSPTSTSASSTPHTGEIIRTLTLDPTKRYHGTGRPPGGPPRTPHNPPNHHMTRVHKFPMSRDITWSGRRESNPRHQLGRLRFYR